MASSNRVGRTDTIPRSKEVPGVDLAQAMMRITHKLAAGAWIFLIGLTGCLIAGNLQEVSAQENREGFYAGLQVGISMPHAMDVARRYVSYPTRCDVFLYPPSISPPTDDPACQDDTPGVTSHDFEPGTGPAGGLMVGYAMNSLRFEFEYLSTAFSSDVAPIAKTTSSALQTKGSEWSTDFPPSATIREYGMNQFFANVFWDYHTASHWTPFVGAGVGLAHATLDFHIQFVRKPEAEYLQIDFSPDWPEEAKRAAAGTASRLDTYPEEVVFGYQIMAGIDRALNASTTLGIVFRYAGFGDIEHNAPYIISRGHPGILADGVTPSSNDITFSGIGYMALTLNLKYHF